VIKLAEPVEPGHERFGVLLIAVICAFSIEGIAEPGRWEQVVVTAVLGATLLLAFRAAHVRPRLMRGTLVLVTLLFAASVVAALNGTVDSAALRAANALLVALAPAAIVVGVIRTLRVMRSVTLEAVFGVLCVYLLIGMFFAAVYGAIGRASSAGFFAGGEPVTVARTLYFSFSSLTTVGYGDLTARSNLGHTLAVSEALIGQIYLVTIVSLIVGNLSRAPRSPLRDPPEES
jgi:hypothetical protein